MYRSPIGAEPRRGRAAGNRARACVDRWLIAQGADTYRIRVSRGGRVPLVAAVNRLWVFGTMLPAAAVTATPLDGYAAAVPIARTTGLVVAVVFRGRGLPLRLPDPASGVGCGKEKIPIPNSTAPPTPYVPLVSTHVSVCATPCVCTRVRMGTKMNI